MNEIEIKYKINNPLIIKEKLLSFGFSEVCEKEYEDFYFSDKELTFIKNKVCVRLRKKNDETIFTFKPGNEIETKVKCKKEIELPVEFKKMFDILTGLNYDLVVNFKKKSHYFKKDDLTVSIDYVNDEYFVEIEIMSDNFVESKKRILSTAKLLGLNNFESKNYRDLMLEKKMII